MPANSPDNGFSLGNSRLASYILLPMMPSYLQHTLTPVSKKDEMKMGINLQPERRVTTTAAKQ